MPISVTPLDAALGAEVGGLDVRDISPVDAQALREAFLEHHVLIVHGSTVGDDDLVRFGECFGPLEPARNQSPLSSRPEVWVISNIRMDGKLLGALPDGEMSFHFDRIHQTQPNKAGVLHAIEIPGQGGDTWFANMCRAYETLPEKTRQRLDGLTARNIYEYGSVAAGGPISADAPKAVHPVVRTIPETGRKALYVCRLMTDRINELAPDESRALIDELCDHIEDPKLVYAHKWRIGDILIWDNRCTMHKANADYPAGATRLMHRIIVAGTAPA
jgi:alpha-ketoglutarate-dependent taurine dioxygenase